MPTLDLAYDEGKRLFSLAALAIRPTERRLGHLLPEAVAPITVEFFLDTGSNTTSLEESAARRLGFDLESLDPVQVGGITGITHYPAIPKLTLLLGESTVDLEQVAVLKDFVQKVQKKSGKFVREGQLRAPAISLLGLDALKALGATVVIEMGTTPPSGRIEW